MKSPLSLESLEVLDAIERKGSFAAAAAKLNRVPSAVSYTVQKLEQDLGVTLFEKQGRRAVLTQAGRLLLERGRQILLAAEELTYATRQLATGWEPRLRIAVDTIVPVETILPAIADLYEIQPSIDVHLSSEVLGGTWEALQENRVELIIGAVGGVPGHQGIHCESWLQVDHVFVASPEHPACALPQPITLEALQAFRSVVVSDTSRHSPALSRGLINQRSSIYVPSMAAKIAAHRMGLGVGYVPRHSVADDLASGELIVLAIEQERPAEPCMLAWKVANSGQALKWLVERLRQDGVGD